MNHNYAATYKLTVEDLLSSNFIEYPISPHDRFDRVFHRLIRTDKGKKLYVHVRFWEFSKYSNEERGKVDDGFDAICYLELHGESLQITKSVSNMTPQAIMDWFERVFDTLKCDYYEENQ